MKKFTAVLLTLTLTGLILWSCSKDSPTKPKQSYRITEISRQYFSDYDKQSEDERKEVFSYDMNGRIVSALSSGTYGSSKDSLVYANTTTKQPSEMISLQNYGKGWVEVERVSFKYTGGKVTEIMEVEYDEAGDIVWGYKYTYSYTGDLLIKRTSDRYDSGSWNERGVANFIYESGKLTEVNWEESYPEYDEYYASKSVISYSGSLVNEILNYSYDSGEWINDGKHIYTYTGGKILERLSTYYWYDHEYKSRYSYQFSGANLTRLISDHYENEVWKKDWKENYYYDEFGNYTEWHDSYWREDQNDYVLEYSMSYKYEQGSGNYRDIMKVWQPVYFYTGGMYQMIYPHPMPSKKGEMEKPKPVKNFDPEIPRSFRELRELRKQRNR